MENEESENEELEDGSGSEGEPESEGGSEPELRLEEMLEGDSDEIPPLEGDEIYVLMMEGIDDFFQQELEAVVRMPPSTSIHRC